MSHTPEMDHSGAPPANTPLPSVAIIVPCKNEVEFVREALRAILAQNYAGPLEVIVADGMSEDGTREILAEFTDPRLRVIDNPRMERTIALNLMVHETSAEIVVPMDAHALYDPDYVSALVSAFRRTGAVIAGGPWRSRADTWKQRAIQAVWHSPFAVGGGRAHDPNYEGPIDSVWCGAFIRARFLELGGYDEAMVRTDDDDLAWRVRQAGGLVWQERAVRAEYRVRPSIGKLARQYFQYGYWRAVTIHKHGKPTSVRHLMPALFVAGTVIAALVGIAWTPAWWALAGVWSLYTVSILFASVAAAARWGWTLIPLLPLCFLAFHLPYGLGTLLGFADVLRRRVRRSPGVMSFTR